MKECETSYEVEEGRFLPPVKSHGHGAGVGERIVICCSKFLLVPSSWYILDGWLNMGKIIEKRKTPGSVFALYSLSDSSGTKWWYKSLAVSGLVECGTDSSEVCPCSLNTVGGDNCSL